MADRRSRAHGISGVFVPDWREDGEPGSFGGVVDSEGLLPEPWHGGAGG